MEARDPSQIWGFQTAYGIIQELRPETALNPSYEGLKSFLKYAQNMNHHSGPGPLPKVGSLNFLLNLPKITS